MQKIKRWRIVSAHVSPRRLCRLTRVDTFLKSIETPFTGMTHFYMLGSQTVSRVRIHQPFSRTFILSKIRKFECNITSDWLNHTVWPIRSYVTFNASKYREKKSITRPRMFSKMVSEYGP